MKDSQNGFDNSGKANRTIWLDETHYRHDTIGEWMGPWDEELQEYTYISLENIRWGIKTSADLVEKWGHHPALYALQPLNEPWG